MKLVAILFLLLILGLFSSFATVTLAYGAQRFAGLLAVRLARFSDFRYLPDIALARYTLLTRRRSGFFRSAIAAIVLALLPISPAAASTLATRLAESRTQAALLDVRRQFVQENSRIRGLEDEPDPKDEITGAPPDLWSLFDSFNLTEEIANGLRLEAGPLSHALYLDVYRRAIRVLKGAEAEYSQEVGDWVIRHSDFVGSVPRRQVVSVLGRFTNIYRNTTADATEVDPLLSYYAAAMKDQAAVETWVYSLDPEADSKEESSPLTT